jgi:hypothetical protein
VNLQILNQSLSRNLQELYPIVTAVFDTVITRTITNGRSINVKTFIDTLNQQLKGTRVRVVREITKRFGSSVENNGQYYPAIGGYCYESTPKKPARIKIILCIHPSTNRLELSKESWEYFKYRFLKCLSHELVHRAQFENGRRLDNVLIFRPHALPNLPKRVLQTQTYLGDMDEVEAYAHDCVEEWYYLNPRTPLTTRAIKEEFRNKGGRLPAVQYYHETFLGDESHPSVKRFFRKVKDWDEIINPVSFDLPGPPSYVKRNARLKRDVRLV